MNHDELMCYVARIMIPANIRTYFTRDNWQNRGIPKKDGDNFIEYSTNLKRIVSIGDPKTFRDFLRRNSSSYENEAEEFLKLDDKTLSSLADLIKFEQASEGFEGTC